MVTCVRCEILRAKFHALWLSGLGFSLTEIADMLDERFSGIYVVSDEGVIRFPNSTVNEFVTILKG